MTNKRKTDYEQTREIVEENMEEIVEYMKGQDSGFWFYIYAGEDGEIHFSSMLSKGTVLNPENWEKDEWIVRFPCDPEAEFWAVADWIADEEMDRFVRYPTRKEVR